ncbi:hypothetical protein D1D72_00010 [Salmonella enterica]|nr:hypothetical protein [Salmonella enterica]
MKKRVVTGPYYQKYTCEYDRSTESDCRTAIGDACQIMIDSNANTRGQALSDSDAILHISALRLNASG